MGHVKTVLKGLQNGVNSLGPYVIGTLGAAAAIHTGQEKYWNDLLPENFRDLPFYLALGALNLGVIYPTVKQGPVNYVRGWFDKEQDDGITLNPNGKSVLIAAALSLGIASDDIRESTGEALNRIYNDVESLIDEKHVPPVIPHIIKPADLGDLDLESRITSYVNRLRAKGLARQRGIEDYSIFAKDLRDGEIIVDINTDVPRLAASTNKVYVLLAVEDQVSKEKLEYSPQLERNMIGMIRSSNNPSTDWLIDQVGGEVEVNEIVKAYGFEDTVIEKIRQAKTGGRTLGNVTSVEDLSDFLQRLYEKKFPRSDEMIKILSLDGGRGHPDRIVDLSCIYDSNRFLRTNGGYISGVADKTGYLWGANNEAGIAEAEFFDEAKNEVIDDSYIIVFMIEDEEAKPDNFRPGAWGPAKSETGRSISESIFWRQEQKYSDIPVACKEDGKHKGVHPQ